VVHLADAPYLASPPRSRSGGCPSAFLGPGPFFWVERECGWLGVAKEAGIPTALISHGKGRSQVERDVRVRGHQRDRDRGKAVAETPGIDFGVRPPFRSGDDGISVPFRERFPHREPMAAKQEVELDKMNRLMEQRHPLIEIFLSTDPDLVRGREQLQHGDKR
jgi:hypothetical protein